MDLNSLIVRSFKNILFAVAVIAMTLPILLSMPGFSGYIVNALNVLGIGE